MPSPRPERHGPRRSRSALRSMALLLLAARRAAPYPGTVPACSHYYATPVVHSSTPIASDATGSCPPPHPIGGRSLPGHAERPAEARPHPPLASWASTSVLRARGRSRGGIRAALSGSAAAPVSGAAGVTCPALGAAGSSGDRGLSSRRRPRLLSRCRHARLLHHFFQRRARSLVLSGRERLMHRAC